MQLVRAKEAKVGGAMACVQKVCFGQQKIQCFIESIGQVMVWGRGSD